MDVFPEGRKQEKANFATKWTREVQEALPCATQPRGLLALIVPYHSLGLAEQIGYLAKPPDPKTTPEKVSLTPVVCTNHCLRSHLLSKLLP